MQGTISDWRRLSVIANRMVSYGLAADFFSVLKPETQWTKWCHTLVTDTCTGGLRRAGWNEQCGWCAADTTTASRPGTPGVRGQRRAGRQHCWDPQPRCGRRACGVTGRGWGSCGQPAGHPDPPSHLPGGGRRGWGVHPALPPHAQHRLQHGRLPPLCHSPHFQSAYRQVLTCPTSLSLWSVEVLLYVHRNRRVIGGREPTMVTSTFTQLLICFCRLAHRPIYIYIYALPYPQCSPTAAFCFHLTPTPCGQQFDLVRTASTWRKFRSLIVSYLFLFSPNIL